MLKFKKKIRRQKVKRTLLGSCDVKRLKRTDSSVIEGVIAALSSRTDNILDVSFTIARVRVEI